jgi:DNA-directed RNA polymerase subunit RPC12/RpoP
MSKSFFSYRVVMVFALLNTALLWATSTQQDQSELVLSLRRDFGYSSGTGSIQGTFSISANGPADLARVVFFIDDQPIGEDSEHPFSIRFSTDSYALGEHTFKAVGYTSDGRELSSNLLRREFVPADEGTKAAMRIALPIIGLVLAVTVLAGIVPLLAGRGRRLDLPLGAPRNYGFIGGTICPKCSRPFAMHFLRPNLLVGKLDRCPYCGRWSLVRSRPMSELRAAEAAELEMAKAGTMEPVEDAEEKARKELEDSRFVE